MKGFKVKKKLKKSIFSCIAIVAIVISIVSVSMFNAQADVAENPNLKVEVNATPNPAYEGEDITVTTTITPEPFTRNASKQQIVLVLDVSGSMEYTVTGTRTKRIDALKEAAKNFIETVSKNIDNLEICIVEYSTNAVINPERISGNLSIRPVIGSQTHTVYNYISAGEKFFNAKTDKSKLLSMVDCLKAKGGTNIGEGLRKANYMLSEKGDANAEKSLVFMTDGEPTHYSVYKPNSWTYDYYDFIDNKTPSYSSEDLARSLAYSTLMADFVKDNGYTAYSVGFAIDSNKLYQIHKSMGGKDDDYLITDNDIDNAFNTIADTISSTVNVTDVQITLNLDGFTVESYEGNVIKLDNIVYTYNKQKKQYEAEPIEFSFVIKGEKAGTYDPLKDSYLSYTVEGKTEKINLGGLSIKVNERETPNINAELLTDGIISRPGEEIEIRYKITTDQFGYYTGDNNAAELSVKDAKLNFDLGENFVAAENGGLINNNGTYEYILPEIKYTKTGDINSEGQAIWKQINENLEITFKVRVAAEKVGDLTFANAENNTITYTNFAKDIVSKQIAIPKVTSNNVTITHGIYSEEEGKAVILNSIEPLKFAKETVATFAASIQNCANATQIELQISDSVVIGGAINVYRVLENGELLNVGTMEEKVNEPGKYIYTVLNQELGTNEASDIMIIYSEKLPSEDKVIKNTVSVNGTSVDAIINCTEELPDLF